MGCGELSGSGMSVELLSQLVVLAIANDAISITYKYHFMRSPGLVQSIDSQHVEGMGRAVRLVNLVIHHNVQVVGYIARSYISSPREKRRPQAPSLDGGQELGAHLLSGTGSSPRVLVIVFLVYLKAAAITVRDDYSAVIIYGDGLRTP